MPAQKKLMKEVEAEYFTVSINTIKYLKRYKHDRIASSKQTF